MFIGRKDVLDELTEAYNSGIRRFVLHGVGGVGKTRTFLRFGSDYKANYSAQVNIDMRGLDENPTSAFDAMSKVILQFNPEQQINPATIENDYRRFVQQQPTMLFLDNAADIECVEPMCQASNLCVFVTSRNRFNLTDAKQIELKQMSEADAVALMFSIADEGRFENKANELAKLAGYLPMALKVLASIIKDDIDEDESIHQIIEKYQDIQKLFKERVPDYHNLTIDASFELSYNRLSADLQRHWRYLSVFPADFDAEAINAVLQIDNGNKIKKILRKASLLEATENKRSLFHDLARVYARGKLTADELFEAERLHCEHFGKLLCSLDKVTLPNLAIFDIERTNIEHGFGWLRDKVELDDDYAQFCSDYVGYASSVLMLRLHFREFISWLETGLKASQKTNDKQHIGTNLGNLGNVYVILGEYRKAIEYQEQGLHISREISNRQDEAAHLGDLGVAYNNLGEYHIAIEYHEQALHISKEIGNRLGEMSCLGNLGNSYSSLGEYHIAIEYHEQALQISREIGDQLYKGTIIGNLGSDFFDLGEYRKAIEYYEDALKSSKEIGDRAGEGRHLGNLGNACFFLGEKDKARYYYLQAIAILEAIESPGAEIFRQNLALINNMVLYNNAQDLSSEPELSLIRVLIGCFILLIIIGLIIGGIFWLVRWLFF